MHDLDIGHDYSCMMNVQTEGSKHPHLSRSMVCISIGLSLHFYWAFLILLKDNSHSEISWGELLPEKDNVHVSAVVFLQQHTFYKISERDFSFLSQRVSLVGILAVML